MILSAPHRHAETSVDAELSLGGAAVSPEALLRAFEGRIAIVIAAYNEEQALGPLLTRIPSELEDLPVQVLVVDDGSPDGTAELAAGAGAAVARLPVNRGQGAALQLAYGLLREAAPRLVVTMDADGQHRPEDLAAIVEPVLSGRAAFVQGSRVIGAAEPNTLARDIGIAFFNRLVRALTRTQVTDCSNSFRAIHPDVLAAVELRQPQFQAAELLIEAVTRGFPYEEVPVTVLRRAAGISRKPGTLRYGWGFARAIVTTWARTRRRPAAGRTAGGKSALASAAGAAPILGASGAESE
jgi:glycosyltransferase involved in cell wall biosynthesis